MSITGQRALDKFRRMERQLRRATIIEHRPKNNNVVGYIEYGGVNAGGASIGIGWHHHDVGNRTTLFLMNMWEIEIIDNVVFFKRTKPGSPQPFDMPWEDCELYTIFLTPRA